MVKLRKEKILVSLVVITLMALVFGSLTSLATTIQPNTNSSSNTSTNTNTNTNSNSSGVSATVGSSSDDNKSNTNRNNTANTNRNNSVNNANRNSSTNSSSLPYAGSGSSVVFIGIALVASALYAYKKVSDYNV